MLLDQLKLPHFKLVTGLYQFLFISVLKHCDQERFMEECLFWLTVPEVGFTMEGCLLWLAVPEVGFTVWGRPGSR